MAPAVCTNFGSVSLKLCILAGSVPQYLWTERRGLHPPHGAQRRICGHLPLSVVYGAGWQSIRSSFRLAEALIHDVPTGPKNWRKI